MKSINLIIVLLLCSAIELSLKAQTDVLISGSVVDASNNQGLPYATVSLKKNLIGVITNELGTFELHVPELFLGDTLQVNYIGYKSQVFSLKTISSTIRIKLQQEDINLTEIVVKPQPPEYYIKLAVLNIKNNYPKEPFQSQAYYREKILENKNFIECNEGVFKTYCPNYLDTLKSQHQLLLFREEENIHEISFRSEERKKSEEKEKKKTEKQNEKNKKKGIPNEPKSNENKKQDLNIVSSFGGPSEILEMSDITNHPSDFLDTNKFKNYKYTFSKSSSYNSNELMVIDFKSKGKIDHARSSGRIYLDASSYAIVKVENNADFIIPVIIRPVLFLYGVGIDNPTFTAVSEFQNNNGLWYPKNIQYNININLSNNHWFKPDEHSNFEIEGIYTVNKLKISNVSSIPSAKRFNSEKEMKGQVHNDEGINWSGINIIKK